MLGSHRVLTEQEKIILWISEAADELCDAITAMFRCVVRLEIKGCDFYCDGSGYGGDRDVIHQG